MNSLFEPVITQGLNGMFTIELEEYCIPDIDYAISSSNAQSPNIESTESSMSDSSDKFPIFIGYEICRSFVTLTKVFWTYFWYFSSLFCPTNNDIKIEIV